MSADTILSLLSKVRKMGPDRWHRPLPCIKYLAECFDVNPDTGSVHWKHRPESHFKTSHEFKRWNTRYAGKLATTDNGSGYLLVCVDSVRFKAHRVVFAIANNVDPSELMIDHVDGNPSNNRASNLRLATPSENAVNFAGARGDSTHGVRGVTWNTGNKKWEATLYKDGRHKFLGLFEDKEAARIAAYEARIAAFGEFFRSQNDR